MPSLINEINKFPNAQPQKTFQNITHEKAEKIIKKHYQDAYKEDMKKHKIGFAMLCGMAITGLTAFFTCKTERLLSGLMGFGSLICLLFSSALKPKKEKYDEMMQKELNEVV